MFQQREPPRRQNKSPGVIFGLRKERGVFVRSPLRLDALQPAEPGWILDLPPPKGPDPPRLQKPRHTTDRQVQGGHESDPRTAADGTGDGREQRRCAGRRCRGAEEQAKGERGKRDPIDGQSHGRNVPARGAGIRLLAQTLGLRCPWKPSKSG